MPESSIDENHLREAQDQCDAILARVNGDISKEDFKATQDELSNLERRFRLNVGDTSVSAVYAAALVRADILRGDLEGAISTYKGVSRRRAQGKQAQERGIKVLMESLDSLLPEGSEAQEKVLGALVEATLGQIVVEGPHCRLVLRQAMLQSELGDTEGAAKTIQSVAADTSGQLTEKEKYEYVLHQVRLIKQSGDWLRARIVSSKMNVQRLKESKHSDVYMAYLALRVELAVHFGLWYDAASFSWAAYEEERLEDKDRAAALTDCLAALSLCPCDAESLMLTGRVCAVDHLALEPPIETLAFRALVAPATLALAASLSADSLSPLPDFTHPFVDPALLRRRHLTRQLLVLSKRFGRVSLSLLAELTGRSVEEVEAELIELDPSVVPVQIDRPKEMVQFSPDPEADHTISEWVRHLRQATQQLESACHLIDLERLKH
ncbi:hypothetical protein KIPB_002215 [Kipferlia bialata]|uniref:PSMD12/CSN4-like N-terminal domain-containing protein n=1 Tax=Kipferlia bialata TaxID=797122 RepID=A0A391NMA0_9EUKA|nr:hypothetical protein KIPB_002215 [Kipferlia bialata]|eukprot:g2215.t1